MNVCGLLLTGALLLSTAAHALNRYDDMTAFLHAPARGGLEFRQFKKFPLYHIKFTDSRTQGLAFNKAARFVDGPAPGPSASAHDFSATDLARYYSQTRSLNVTEKHIQRELLKLGILRPGSEAAVISTAGRGYPGDPEHELNHGVYFIDAGYRHAARALWHALPEHQQRLAKALMKTSFPYRFENEDLLVREFTAYFRDPATLMVLFADPLGKQRGTSGLSEYYERGKLKVEVRDSLMQLARAVRLLDHATQIYSTPVPTMLRVRFTAAGGSRAGSRR